uniref:Large ribosomal subunit protein uL29c n=1 Tax=Kalanchoe fedtschenkoi TaxID=63787 RepID=A0A7N1A280_KALFE
MNGVSIASSSTVIFPLESAAKFPRPFFSGVRLRSAVPQSTPSASIAYRKPAAAAVMMAKREEELKEIRAKSTEQINEEVVDLKGELLMLRLQRSARNEFKSSEFRRMRKRVARMLTVKREREIEDGIKKRYSRKLDRQWKKSIVVRPPPSLIKLREEEAAAEAAENAS